MKNFFSFISLLCSMQLFAQTPITLTRADFPKPTTSSTLPDSVLYTNVIGANVTAQSMSGPNLQWNEGALSGNTQYQQFVPLSATPLVFQLAFLTCDYAQPLLNAGNIGMATASEAYEYYDYASSNSKLQIKGYGANISIPGLTTTPIPLPALYNSPDVVYKFPITYGNIDSSESGFSVTLPLPAPIGNVTINRQQKRVNIVDAWGNITTPAGSFDVLRVVSTIDRIDSVISAFATFGTPSQPVEYKWLGAGKKIPVLQINGNIIGGSFTPTNVSFWGQGAVSTHQINADAQQLFIYPNPASSYINFQFQQQSVGEINCYILTPFGQKMGEFHFNKFSDNLSASIPVMGLPSGNYILRIVSANKASMQTFAIRN